MLLSVCCREERSPGSGRIRSLAPAARSTIVEDARAAQANPCKDIEHSEFCVCREIRDRGLFAGRVKQTFFKIGLECCLRREGGAAPYSCVHLERDVKKKGKQDECKEQLALRNNKFFHEP